MIYCEELVASHRELAISPKELGIYCRELDVSHQELTG